MATIKRERALTYDDVLLVPQYSEVLPVDVALSSNLVTTDIHKSCSKQLQLPIPFFSSAMDTVTEFSMAKKMAQMGGIGVIHKNMSIEQQAHIIMQLKASSAESLPGHQSSLDDQNKLLTAAAIGVGPLEQQRVQALITAGVDIILIDTAHGHSLGVIEMVKYVRNLVTKISRPIFIVAGNVATAQGTEALIKAGADIIKVGIGPGSICTTRIVAGVGVPQLQAILDCAPICQQYQKQMIADGGIKASGDIVKAIAAGANFVMLGSLLAGTDESPGEKISIDGKKYKTYRGMGSLGAMVQGSKDRYGQASVEHKQKLVAEGVSGLVPYQGSLENVVYQLMGGLRAGMGYLGAKNYKELQNFAHFITITQAARIESLPHSILSVGNADEE